MALTLASGYALMSQGVAPYSVGQDEINKLRIETKVSSDKRLGVKSKTRNEWMSGKSEISRVVGW